MQNETSANRSTKSTPSLRLQRRKEETIFRHFRIGLSTFFTGMALLYVTKNLTEPSLQQELLSAACITAIALGFIIAIASEIKFIWSRLIYFVRSK